MVIASATVTAVRSAPTVVVLALVGFMLGRPDFLDIALLYALINFVSTIAILKFFRYRSFQVPLVRRGQGGNADG